MTLLEAIEKRELLIVETALKDGELPDEKMLLKAFNDMHSKRLHITLALTEKPIILQKSNYPFVKKLVDMIGSINSVASDFSSKILSNLLVDNPDLALYIFVQQGEIDWTITPATVKLLNPYVIKNTLDHGLEEKLINKKLKI